jgi:hypothetical protein
MSSCLTLLSVRLKKAQNGQMGRLLKCQHVLYCGKEALWRAIPAKEPEPTVTYSLGEDIGEGGGEVIRRSLSRKKLSGPLTIQIIELGGECPVSHFQRGRGPVLTWLHFVHPNSTNPQTGPVLPSCSPFLKKK